MKKIILIVIVLVLMVIGYMAILWYKDLTDITHTDNFTELEKYKKERGSKEDNFVEPEVAWTNYEGPYPVNFSYPNNLEIAQGDADFFSIIHLKDPVEDDRDSEYTIALLKPDTTVEHLIQSSKDAGYSVTRNFELDGQVFSIKDSRFGVDDFIFQNILASFRFRKI